MKQGFRDIAQRTVNAERSFLELRDLLNREFPLGRRPIDFAGKNPADCGCAFVWGEGLRPCPTHDPLIELRERRERIATAVLAGFAAYSDPISGPIGGLDAVASAIEWADALIAALDEPKP